jgi:hypothetical protein
MNKSEVTMNNIPELKDLLPVTCAICDNDRMRATLGKHVTGFYIRLSCPEHGVMIQFRLHKGELQRWAKTIIAQSN